MLGEQLLCRLGITIGETVDNQVCGREWTVAKVGPGGDLERVIAVAGRPRGDGGERAVGHAGRQESEFQSDTSTHASVAAEHSTASVSLAARRPSLNVGRPSALARPRTRA